MTTTSPIAYLLCGPSLSGKSTFATELAKQTGAVIVSADQINEARGLPFGGEGLPESAWAETLRLILERIDALASEGRSVIVDDTLCYRWLRDRFRLQAVDSGLTPILLLFRLTEEEALIRRQHLLVQGTRPVLAQAGLLDHLARFEWPTPDEAPLPVEFVGPARPPVQPGSHRQDTPPLRSPE